MVVANVFRPWGVRDVCQRRRRQVRHAGRAHRALPGRRYDRQRAVRAQQGGGVQPVQTDGPLPRGGTPAVSPQVERGVELDEGRAPRPRAAALRARSPPPIRVNRGRRCISLDAAFALSSALAVTAALPAVAPPRVLGGFAGNPPISPWVLDFCAVFGGGCSLSAQPTWGNAGAGWRFGPIRPAKPPRSCKWGSRVARGARRHCGG